MSGYGELLEMAFSNKKPEPPKPIAPPIINQPIEQNPQLESRDQVSPDVMANVQSYVWNNGTPPPPKAPNQANNDRGISANMAKDSGWGRAQ
jgi:hypothetical protein